MALDRERARAPRPDTLAAFRQAQAAVQAANQRAREQTDAEPHDRAEVDR